MTCLFVCFFLHFLGANLHFFLGWVIYSHEKLKTQHPRISWSGCRWRLLFQKRKRKKIKNGAKKTKKIIIIIIIRIYMTEPNPPPPSPMVVEYLWSQSIQERNTHNGAKMGSNKDNLYPEWWLPPRLEGVLRMCIMYWKKKKNLEPIGHTSAASAVAWVMCIYIYIYTLSGT